MARGLLRTGSGILWEHRPLWYRHVAQALPHASRAGPARRRTAWLYSGRGRITGRLLLLGQKVHGGLDFPVDYPSRSDERFLHHDQTMRIDYVLGGAGLEYAITPEWLVSGSWGTTLWGGGNGHEVHHVILVALTRMF